MLFPSIGEEVIIKKGDRVLMQRTPENEKRIMTFMDMQWATVRGFNTHGNIIIWFNKEDGDTTRHSKRRDIKREDIIFVEHKQPVK